MRKAAFLLAAIFLLPAFSVTPAADTPGTAVTIAGPERLAVSTEGGYNVKIFGPADILWGFWVNVSGARRADVTLSSPDGTVDSSNGYIMSQTIPLEYPEFNFTLTAPAATGSLLIAVTALAMEGAGAAGQTATARWSVDVKAVRAVMLNTTVRNGGEIPVSDLKVAFMVRLGGAWNYISNESVPSVEVGGTANVSSIWDTTVLDDGEYTVRIVVDPDGEKVQYSGSRTYVEKRIVLREVGAKAEPPWFEKYQRAIGFLLVIVFISVGLYYWYWRKKVV